MAKILAVDYIPNYAKPKNYHVLRNILFYMTNSQIDASDPEYSVWVAASAGSGKTTVLTSRVLRLLLGGTHPGKILCLTYTNAGAAEMECRIKDKLCRWVTLPEDKLVVELQKLSSNIPDLKTLERARKLFLEMLDTPDGIKIQTIHSFCQGLMRRFPLEAGVVPHFKVMDDKTAKELLKEARTRLLSNKEACSSDVAVAMKNIFWRIREGTFSRVIEAIISDRDKFENAIEKAGGVAGLKLAIFKLLDVLEGASEGEFLRGAVQEGSFDRQSLQACAIGLMTESGKTFVERGEIICAWLEKNAAERQEGFDDYKLAFLTKENQPRKGVIPVKSKVPLQPLINEQERVCKIINDIKKIKVATLSASMVDIAWELLRFYNDEKSGRAYLDYTDLIMKSENLLLKSDITPWVLYKLDGGIDHILLDEAQDTSPQQWHIIDSLCVEFFSGSGARNVHRTVFVVGDEKQSIFSFQGAAPQTFNQMQAKFRQRVEGAGKKWRSVRLDKSFRSSPVILQAVDAVGFGLGSGSWGLNNTHQITDQQNQISNIHAAYHKEMFGKVEVWPLIEHKKEEAESGWVMPLEYKDKQDTRKILAEKIADTIKNWLDDGRILESEGRPVKAGDIIILLRKRKDMADNIISSLKKRNVPVAGHDRLIVTQHIAVMDLIALGNFLLLPEDDLSLACVLKSPLVGFSEDDLFAIAHKRGSKSLWQSLQEFCHTGNIVMTNAYDYFSSLLGKVDFLSPFALYCHVLEAIDGRKQLIQRLGFEVNDPVDEFLSMAMAYEKLHPPSLQGFLRWLESGKSEIKRDMEQASANIVRVMTVHASKGLEAPIVIMPDTVSDFASSKEKIFWYEQGELDVMLWPGGADKLEEVCQSIKQQRKYEQEGEYYRLLYVAMTRAKSELYVMGATGSKARQNCCWYDVISNALSEIAISDDDGVMRMCYGKQAKLRKLENIGTIDTIMLPEYLLKNPNPEPNPTHPLMPSQIAGQTNSGIYEESARAKIIEGKIIHNLLEFLPDIAEKNRLEIAQKFLHKQNQQHSGINIDIENILHNLSAMMLMEEVKEVFGINSRSEVPIVGVLDGVVVSARIDRLCVLDDRVIIVDYKTGRPSSHAKINKGYIKQIKIYRGLIQKIYPEKQIECYIIWTQTCEIDKLDNHAVTVQGRTLS